MNADQMAHYAIRGATRYLKLRHAMLNPEDPQVRAVMDDVPALDAPPTEALFDELVDRLPEPPR